MAQITAAHSGKNENQRLAEGEAILSDHVNGMPASALCEKYHVSKATLYRRIDTAIKERLAPTVDAYREQQNAILDEQVARVNQHLAAANVMMAKGEEVSDLGVMERGMAHHLKAMEMLTRIVERRAKLNGLDAPVTANVHITVSSPVDDEIEALTSAMRARSASRAG